MADLAASASAIAIATSGAPTAPEGSVELRILYNPFAPDEVEVHSLEYQPGATLERYLEGLPTEAEWMVFLNGEEVQLADAAAHTVGEDDRIGLLLVPQGGGFKSVLRIVLQAAAIALAFVPGIGWAAALAINVGIGLINAFLLTPKPPKAKSQEDENSYGIDGPKNSATEDIPYPIVYGTFRVAGNFSDVYTENVGDNQYLYLRTVLNDGKVKSISDIEINEQPIENFKDVQTRIELGDIDAGLNDWFSRSTVQHNKGGIALGTGWTTHTTTSEVDKVRFDVTFPSGLVSINKKKGTYSQKAVTFELQYRRIDPVTGNPITGWTNLPAANISEAQKAENNAAIVAGLFGKKVVVSAAAPPDTVVNNQTAMPAVEYRPTTGGAWTRAGEFAVDPTAARWQASGYAGNATPYVNQSFEVDLPEGDFEFRGIDGAQLVETTTYPTSGSARFTVRDSRTKQIRKSFETERVEKGYYEVGIRRTNAQSTDQYEIDACVLTDVAEIDVEPVAMRGTANLSLRIRLNEQLNAIPTVTAKVEGCELQEYDIDGNPTVVQHSDNMAWIGLDILCGEQRGGGMSLDRIDWPRFLEFAQECEDKGIGFNGVFASKTNLGDALQQVLRIGHAAPVPFGKKVSLAIDKPRDPVTVFTQAGMVKGTFQISYLSMQERANDFEVTYYDKNDRNKEKAIRYVDQKAVTFNEMPRKASVSLVGVDNIEQARAELWRMIYANRLIIRTITFESFMESINCIMGDVALIQHDQMEWADNGRIAGASSTTVVDLDQKVTTIAGKTYAILVHFSALKRADKVVVTKAGSKLMIPTSSISDASAPRITRVRLSNDSNADFEVLSITKGEVYDTIQVNGDPTGIGNGSSIELWDTDVIEERTVSGIQQLANGNTRVTVTTAFPAVPSQYANFVFGEVVNVRKPYVLTGVSGTGIEKRRLTFVEYNEGVYSGGEVDIPIPTFRRSDREVAHVQALMFDYENLAAADRRLVNARIHWATGDMPNYGGADVYMSLNGEGYRVLGTAVGTSQFNVQLSPDDTVSFKVVAFNARGDRAPIATAPSVNGDIVIQFADLDPPTNVYATPVAFEVDGKVEIGFTSPADQTGVEGYEIQYKRDADIAWISAGVVPGSPLEIPGLTIGTYDVRVRSTAKKSTSIWVEETFVIVATLGSIMANFQSGNDRNGSPIIAPTLPGTGAVEHTTNTDGTVNISAEWQWAGDEAEIDGFIIDIDQSTP